MQVSVIICCFLGMTFASVTHYCDVCIVVPQFLPTYTHSGQLIYVNYYYYIVCMLCG